ncbi:hypothetical protein, partial [Enterobacter hormaechei]|uniref:hypothetical protein n=1 Tax=Enterobacter hormaechei TaxID=158836 RepID=UPI0023E39356
HAHAVFQITNIPTHCPLAAVIVAFQHVDAPAHCPLAIAHHLHGVARERLSTHSVASPGGSIL